MTIDTISSHNMNSLFAYEKVKQTNLQQTQNPTEKSSATFVADICEISDEAKKIAEEEALQKQFSERAYHLLKIRNISDEDMAAFKGIIEEAKNAEDAKAFLKTLSTEERDLVKRANSYGMALDNGHIDQMSEEGARNMLVEPDYRAYVDFNNDGIVDHGLGKTFVFPPPNAPDEVKDAWDKTVEGMSDKDRFLASAIFLSQSLSANLETDASGKVTNIRSPGDTGYVNIFPTNKEDWFLFLDDTDSYLDFSESVADDPLQLSHIKETRSLIDLFRNNLKD
jgi:hypothetical protein